MHPSSVGSADAPSTWSGTTLVETRAARRAALVDDCLIPLALAAVAIMIFSPALRNDFVLWDDVALFTNNPGYRGLGWAQIRWMFTTTLMGHWVPLTWLTHGLDYVLWGMNPVGYHLVNLLLHGANAALFYFVARRLLAKATSFPAPALRLAAIAASMFFALHPLRVESVAWATERRDVLSGLFYFLTLLTYLNAAEATGRRRTKLLVSSLVLYVLAFTSKSIVMTLPFVLVLLDVYPLGRLRLAAGAWRNAQARAVWREKAPYFAIALAGGIVAFLAQQQFFTSTARLGWTTRPLIALYGVWFYVTKTAVPLGLSPLYELPLVVSARDPKFLVPALGVLLVSATVLLLRRRWPAGLALWLYYGLVIGPVAGLTHAGFQLAHDRYSYLSCLGWALLVGAGVGAVVGAHVRGSLRPAFASAIAAAALLGLTGLGTLTWQQIDVWRSTENLWRYAIENEEACAICQNNLGALLYNQGHFAVARGYLERALELRPDRDKVHKDLGLTKMQLGLNAEAVAHFQRAVELSPSDAEIRNDLGVALLRERRHREALAHLRYALTLRPDDVMVLSNIGQVYVDIGTPERGVPFIERAVTLDPKAPRSHVALGLAYAALGRPAEAREQYDIVAKLDRREASLLGPALLVEW